MSVNLHITRQTPVPRGLLGCLRPPLRGVLPLLGQRTGSWSITLVDDATMMELHHRTMGLPTTTDVLTFDLRDRAARRARPAPGDGGPLELDTVICLDEAARRALDLGHPLFHEVLLYAIHSLLHVCGYDDRTAALARKMHQEEDRLLICLKIGPVFHRNDE